MAEEKKVEEVEVEELGKSGILVKAQRASDEYNEHTDKDQFRGYIRYYPNLDGEDTLLNLKNQIKEYLYSNQEDYIFYDKSKKEIKNDNIKIKDIADYNNEKDKIYVINAKKIYKMEEPGDTQEFVNKLIEEITLLDNKALYALASIDGSNVVLNQILKLLNQSFQNINEDPRLQTILSIVKTKENEMKNDKETIAKNQSDMQKLLTSMSVINESDVDKARKIMQFMDMGFLISSGLQWGVKKAYKRFTKNKQVYEGPKTKWQSRFNKLKNVGKAFLKGALKVGQAALQLAQLGLAIYGMVNEDNIQKEHWKTISKQLIEQKKKRYDDYEDIYSQYNDLSDTIWMLHNIFITNFKPQCSDSLKLFKIKPTMKQIKDNDSTLRDLINATSDTLGTVMNYLNGLVKNFTKVDTQIEMMIEFKDDSYVKSAEGFQSILNREKKNNNNQDLSNKQKALCEDIYVFCLLSRYYFINDKKDIGKILPYDKELCDIVQDFPKNEESLFGANKAPLKDYIRHLRIQYLWFDGIMKNADMDNPDENKSRVTFDFMVSVQELYNKN